MSNLPAARFLGRDAELAVMREVYERVRSGNSATVVLVGDAGVGKTRLMQEFCAGIDARLLRGGCVDLGGGALPYGPIIEALRGLEPADPAAARGSARSSSSDLDRLFLPASSGTPAHDDDRGALFRAVLGLLEDRATMEPVALVIEDLHWADRSSLDLLSYLIHTLRDRPVLVLTSVRRDGLEPDQPIIRWLSEATRHPATQRLDLEPFTYEEVRELVTAHGQRPDERLLETIFARSDGNAFFVEELLALRGEQHDELPPSLRDVLAAQLARLSPRGRVVLSVAAAVGRNVDHRLLARVAELPAEELLEGLREAVRLNILVSDHRGAAYRFRHALLREAVHSAMLSGERIARHRRIAEVLTEEPDLASTGRTQAVIELAHHWHEAHEPDRAFSAAVQAGFAAEQTSAFAESLAHLECALDLQPHVDPTVSAAAPARHELLAAASRVAYLAGEHARSLTHTSDALAQVEGGATDRAQLFHRLSELQWGLGAGVEALGSAEAAVAAAGDRPSAALADALGWHSRLLMLTDRHADAIAPAERAIQLARELRVPVAEGFARNSLGCALAGLGQVDEGIAQLREAHRLALEAGAIDDIIRARNNLAAVAGWNGRYEEVVSEARAGVRWAEGRRLRSGSFVTLRLNGVEALLLLGRYEEAAAWLVDTPLPDEPVTRAMLQRAAAWLELDHGDPEVAAGHVAAAVELLGDDPETIDRASLAARRAELDLLAGRPAVAFARLESPGDVAAAWNIDASPAPAWRLAGRAAAAACLSARDRQEADTVADLQDRFEALVDAARQMTAARPPSFLRDSLDQAIRQLEAERTWVLGAPDPEAFVRAASGPPDRLPPIETARLRFRLAETRLTVGDLPGATDAAVEALQIVHRIGAPTLESDIVAFARRGRLEVGERRRIVPSPASPFGLTARERQVLSLVADGRSNGEIGHALYITTKTASAHVSNILTKLGVTKRGEAAAVAHRLGIGVEAPPPAGQPGSAASRSVTSR
jgi:DNA-binding CsgD family transcriptional regulator/tetratricopeptide (TPR) repeat protein